MFKVTRAPLKEVKTTDCSEETLNVRTSLNALPGEWGAHCPDPLVQHHRKSGERLVFPTDPVWRV